MINWIDKLNQFTDSRKYFYYNLYALFALPLLLFLCFKQPVFYTPDEQPHFMRAYQVAHGEWFPRKFEVSPGSYDVGGMIDVNIDRVGGLAVDINHNRTLRITDEMVQLKDTFQWSEDAYKSTPNVSIYPPFLYLPQALGILLGKAFDLSVLDTTTLSRVVNAMSAFLISIFALRITQRGISVLLIFLSMPMTLAQFGSNSPDALCISLTALCAALLTNIDSKDACRFDWKIIALVSGIVVLISTFRPPYLAFSAILVSIAIVRWENQALRNNLLLAFSVINIVVILWTLYVVLFVSVQFGPENVSYEQQLKGVLNAPFSWVLILIHTWGAQWKYIMTSFIGNLGYLDAKLPTAYYGFAQGTILLVVLKNLVPFDLHKVYSRDALYRLLIVIVLLITVCGIYLVLYAAWTPVGSAEIYGVQGRYLIPVALLLCLLCRTDYFNSEASNSLTRSRPIVGCSERLLLTGFSLLTFIVIPWSIGVRFY